MSPDGFILVSFVFLTLGVVGSLAPILPGPVLSLAGVYLYWWATDFQDPGEPLLVVLTLTALVAILVDLFGPALASRAGGASSRTALVAGLLGVAGLLIGGPTGMILAVFLTALILELYRQSSLRRGTRAALASLLGAVGSPVLQVLLTLTILVSMIVVSLV